MMIKSNLCALDGCLLGCGSHLATKGLRGAASSANRGEANVSNTRRRRIRHGLKASDKKLALPKEYGSAKNGPSYPSDSWKRLEDELDRWETHMKPNTPPRLTQSGVSGLEILLYRRAHRADAGAECRSDHAAGCLVGLSGFPRPCPQTLCRRRLRVEELSTPIWTRSATPTRGDLCAHELIDSIVQHLEQRLGLPARPAARRRTPAPGGYHAPFLVRTLTGW
jgi:hypothetical protein